MLPPVLLLLLLFWLAAPPVGVDVQPAKLSKSAVFVGTDDILAIVAYGQAVLYAL